MATIKHQAINTLKKGDYFKIVTPEHKYRSKPSPGYIPDGYTGHVGLIPERISKTVYVYDGYNRYGKCWNYHPFDNASSGDLHTKNKNRLVTTDFEF